MALKALSDVVTKKDVKEQIFLGVRYRVADWAREGYVTLAQRHKIDHRELSKNPFALSWEKIAYILAARDGIYKENYFCHCGSRFNGSGHTTRYCRCQILSAVNQEFKEELEALEEVSSSVPPLPTSKRVKFLVVQAHQLMGQV